jgi:KaiC/GvpD/RAD55 family RecA-like ATPase
MGGANTLTDKTDFKPLEGKKIIIWPDNDDVGLTYAQNMAEACRSAGAIVSGILYSPEGKPKGWDVADAIEEGFDYSGHIESQNFILQTQIYPAAKVKSGKFGFLHVSEIINAIRPSAWLIKKYLEQHSMALIFGAPASGKSFIAIDMACSIATGTEYHGHKVTQGAVFYIAGEGTNNIRKRLKAWEVSKGISLSQYPLYVSSSPAQFYDETAAHEVEQAIETLSHDTGVKPALIVIDTLARNIGAGDENQTKDMNIFVSHVDAVKDKWQATALIVHHTGLQEQQRARGSSVLKAALDHEYHVVKESNNVRLTCTKMKDAKEPEPIQFEMIELKTGIIDEDGEEETSCILEPSWIDSFVKSVTGQSKKLLELIQTEMVVSGELLSPNKKIQSVLCLKMDVLKDVFKTSGIVISVNSDTISKGFKRSIKTLKKGGLVDFTSDYLWLTDKPDMTGQTRNG